MEGRSKYEVNLANAAVVAETTHASTTRPATTFRQHDTIHTLVHIA